jgi:hypothetical protein
MDLSFLQRVSNRELLQLYNSLLCELRERHVVRSANNPVADYTEWLAARALGLRLERKSTTGFDGICGAGFRYEIKGRRRTPQNNSVQLSQIRGLDKNHFDYLIGVIYKPDFSVEYAAQLPYEVVLEKAAYREHTNAWILQLRSDLFRDPRVTDITEQLAAAALD